MVDEIKRKVMVSLCGFFISLIYGANGGGFRRNKVKKKI